jgi:hypothetical protein
MLGEKSRFKKNEKLWKYEDGDLSTPEHDELIFQLLNKNNAEQLIKLFHPHLKDESFSDLIKVTAEYPIKSNGENIIGYLDIVIVTGNISLVVEVKPKILSFGTTLRQMKAYKHYLGLDGKDSDFILYSPDTRFKEAFETQGIPQITPSDIGLK